MRCLDILLFPIYVIVYGGFGPHGLFGTYGRWGSGVYNSGEVCMTYSTCHRCGVRHFPTERGIRRHERRCGG